MKTPFVLAIQNAIRERIRAFPAVGPHFGSGAILVLLFLFSTTGLYWWQMTASATRLRQETLTEVQLRGGQLAVASAQIVGKLFHDVDQAAVELVSLYAGDAAAFDRHVKAVEARLPKNSIVQVGVVDVSGYLAYSNLGIKEPTFLGDREHVVVHKNASEDRLFVSRPLLGRVSKQWSIQFSRPILRNGKYAGVIVMSISPAYLKNAVASLILGSGDTVAIFRSSGEYLARSVSHEASLGMKAPADRPFLGDDAPMMGSMRIVSSFDGTKRIYCWQRTTDYPIAVVLGLSEDAFLAPVERIIAIDRRSGVIGTALLWSFTLAVVLLFARQKAAEQALAKLNAELERRVAERTAELETANRELADFSYSVSHDLRSPLRAVAGFAKILEDDYGSSMGDDGRSLLRSISQSGVRMGRLVDGLLDYLGLSRKKLQARPLDMKGLAFEAFAQVAPADRVIHFEVDEALPPAIGDPHFVLEAFRKLLENSIRFTAAKREDSRIWIGASAEPGRNTYFVRDNGIGFDMQYAAKLFCVFERLHTEPGLTGVGIGLAMVKRIIERQGGAVWAEGRVGEGATFYFTLPSA